MKKSKSDLVKSHILEKIEWQVYLVDTKIPSVRGLAQQLGVSTFTVNQAYESLVAEGHIYAVKGSGYFVKAQREINPIPLLSMTQDVFDMGWLMEHLFSEVPDKRASGSGLLPDEWLLEEAHFMTATKKALQDKKSVRGSGYLKGFNGLREQFVRQLDDKGILANPSAVITTTGVSTALTLIVQTLCQTGDTVLVDEPAWYWILACLQSMGVKVVTVPRTPEGVDLQRLEQQLTVHKPKLYLTNSVLHNPTSFNPTPPNLFAVLQLMENHDCYLVEDDICSEFHPDNRLIRYATIDGFKRVFYVSGVSKLLGANWRVGMICAPQDKLEVLLRQKMLMHMNCPELTERVIYHIWQSPIYSRYISDLQLKLTKAHQRLKQRLQAQNLTTSPVQNSIGLFIWLDVGVDSAELALAAHKEGWMVAPGHLFSITGKFTTHIRLNVTTTSDEFISWLGAYVQANQT